MTLFECRTNNAYVIKVLMELLQTLVKTACFEIDEKGIRLSMADHNCDKTILINLLLNAENFQFYDYKSTTPLIMGVNISHLYKILKHIKKKESLSLYIEDTEPKMLSVKVYPKENTRVTTSSITIQNIQYINYELPTGYNKKSILISSSEYMKMIKEMYQIGHTINVEYNDTYVNFKCDTGGLIKRNVEFGDIKNSTTSHLNNQSFNIEQLYRLNKISGLSPNLHLYLSPTLPFHIKTDIGSLGYIYLFIKSKELQNSESCNVEQDSE